MLELAIFCWFSLRILSLVNEPYRDALRGVLFDFSYARDAFSVANKFDLDILEPVLTPGKKGFSLNINMLEDGFTTRNKPKGFGLLGRGTNYYAPMAVVALGCDILDRNMKNKNF